MRHVAVTAKLETADLSIPKSVVIRLAGVDKAINVMDEYVKSQNYQGECDPGCRSLSYH